MVKMRSSILIKIILTLCMVMQCVAVMPHHHHGQSNSACINPLHCINDGESCRTDSSCAHSEGHDHSHDNPITTCSLHQFVNVQPQKEQNQVEACLCDLHCDALYADDDKFANDIVYLQTTFSSACCGEIVPPALWQDYFARALPVRAPSFV